MIDQKYYEEQRTLAQLWQVNAIQFKVLLLIQVKGGQIEYDDSGYHAMTGQPGETLRSMVRRGWLDGPEPKQKPRAKPWSLTSAGRELLRKIRTGLRPPGSYTPYQYQALLRCGENRSLVGLRSSTLDSLVRWGYIYGVEAGRDKVGRLTSLGQEAYDELLAYAEQSHS